MTMNESVSAVRFFCLKCKVMLTPLDEERWERTGRPLCRDCWMRERDNPNPVIPTVPSLGELICRPVTKDEVWAIVGLAGWFVTIILLLS